MNQDKIQEVIMNNIYSLLDVVTGFIPRICAALLLLGIGYLLCKFLAKVITMTLSRMGLDKISAKTGLDELFKSFGMTQGLSHILGKFLFFLFFCVVLMSTADILAMQAVSLVFNQVFHYLPNVFGALLVFIASAIAGHFAQNTVLKTTQAMNLDFAKPLSRLVYFALMLIGCILALSQLKIETAFLTNVIQIILAAIVLALALSLGIGSRDVSKNLISGMYLKDALVEGATVRIGEYEGVLIAVRPVSFELQDKSGKVIILPNARLLDCEIIQDQQKKT